MSLGIDADRWARLKPLLDEALDLEPAQRQAWLDSLPLHHADLAGTLHDLLARAGRDTGLSRPALSELGLNPSATTDYAPPADAFTAGDTFGPYRLVRPLGAGGMGAVWLAERADGLMQRVVALKLPHGPFRGDLAARIAQEREILAALDHPNIARLYDAGVSADGQPFLALEHVDGLRIDHWCDEQRLSVAARLRLFLQAAHAVAYAHSLLVVHRDIKPSNLLVDAQGRVKLLDFGIAKLLNAGPDDPGPRADLTQKGMQLLTPRYASPEQVSGAVVGTRSDVYGLGVLLFELLTGTLPHGAVRQSRAALEDAILHADAPPPSDVATDPVRRRALRGDIDTIVLKTLKKAPAERYASVEALIDDIERHLCSRPVLARPDSLGYRARRFVTRNRIGVVVAAALTAAVFGGAGAALWQARVAIAERQRAEDVKNFTAAIFREANPFEGSGKAELSAVDLLKQADKRLEATLLAQSGARIELTNMIGASLLLLNDIAAAEPIIARAVAEAERTLAPTDRETVKALFLQSQVHRVRGRPQQASNLVDRLLPTLRERVASPGGAGELSTALLHRAQTAIDVGAYAEGERYARECHAVAQRGLDEGHPQRTKSSVLLALALRHVRKYDEALPIAEEAFRRTIAEHGAVAPHPRVIEARSVYARALADTGSMARGIEMLDTSIAETRSLFGAKNQKTGILLQNVVAYRMDVGELETADANGAEALAILGATMPRDAPAYAIALHSRAAVALARRDAAMAVELAAEAADVLDRKIGAGQESAIAARTTVALARMLQGRLDDAAQELNRLEPHAGSLAPGSLQVARVAFARGRLAFLRGDPAAALRHLQPLADSTEPSPKWQRERMRAWASIGWVQLEQGAADKALPAFERALAEMDRLETRATPARADALLGLGRTLLALGDAAKARPPLEQAAAIWRAIDATHRDAAVADAVLARATRAP